MVQPRLDAPVRHFSEIEGLRGYLALWVAVGHAMNFSGIMDGGAAITLLLAGHQAVLVFIILSGFVITHLRLSSQEPYGPYIARRAWRIFPVYVLCFLVAMAMTPMLAGFVQQVPWADAPEWAGFRQERVDWLSQLQTHGWAHILAHLSGLHGLVPDEVLPYANRAFLSPAWSISLEWQFYLVAPFVVAAVRTTKGVVILSLAAIVLAALYNSGRLGSYAEYPTLAQAAGYFAIGIASRLGLERLSALNVSPLGLIAVILGALFFFVDEQRPLLIWGVFYVLLVWGAKAPILGRLFQLAFANPAMRGLGQASYSFYLCHALVMAGVGSAALAVAPAVTQAQMLAFQTGAVVLSILLSLALYQLVERPGTRLGARFARRP